jgi:4-amino-4-deoxy-L-arabinose transferase-like glycosyltransferase
MRDTRSESYPPQLGSVPATRATRHWLFLILVVAVLLRVAAAVYLGDHVTDSPGTFDQISYDMLARQVLAGHGFTVAMDWWPVTPAGEPTAHWSYLYTLYLAGVYSIFGYHPLVARLTQAVLAGILMPWLAYRLGYRHFGRKEGLIAAGLTAVYAYFVYYAGALMTETFYIVAILAVLDMAGALGLASNETPQSRFRVEWLGLGLALAVAVLFRQVFLLFTPFLFGWLLWRSYRHRVLPVRQAISGLLAATVILIAAILPWTLRNYRAFDNFVLLNTNAGFAFFWGNHPIHGSNFISILPDEGPSYQDLIPLELLELDEAALDQALLKRALTFIRDDPGRYLVLSLSRVKDYFKFWPSTESGWISNLSRVLSFGILWPLMVLGLVYYAIRHFWPAEALLLFLFIGIYTTIHLLTWALIRYRLPVDAVLLLFAGVAVVTIQEKLTRHQAGAYRARPSTALQRRD